MNLAETFAMAALNAWLPDATIKFLEAQSRGEHDIEIVYPNGRTAMVEVASVVDSQNLETIAAILGKKKEADLIPVTQTLERWYIGPTKGAKVNLIRKVIDRYLAQLEAAGVRSFDAHMDNVPDEIRMQFESLGISGGDVVDFIPKGYIQLGLPSESGWVGAVAVNDAVLEAANRPDNLGKLALGNHDEKHLFVFVDSSAAKPHAGLFLSDELPLAPDLPPPITHGWVGTYLSTLQDLVVWHCAKDKRWVRRKLHIA